MIHPTPDRPDEDTFLEHESYNDREQREDPNEDERRESLDEARKALHEKMVADELVELLPYIVRPQAGEDL